MSLRQLRSDEGVTLVELIVATFILAIGMAAVAASLLQALQLTQTGRARSVAANLAAEELELLRAVEPEDVEVGMVTRTSDVGGRAFTIRREAEWVASDARTGACEGPGGGDLDVLRLTVSVSWPGSRGAPVTSDTVLSPDAGAFEPGRGHLIVRLADRDDRPLVPQAVWASAASGALRSGVSTRDGCLVFDHLDPGGHTVWVDSPGYVDPAGQQRSEHAGSVFAAASTTVSIAYDRAATLRLDLAGAQGGLVPAGLDVRLRNTALQPDMTRTVPGTGDRRDVPGLFPFADGYEAWAAVGDCADADPGHHGHPRASLVTRPGQTGAGSIVLPTVAVDVRNPGGNSVPGVQVTAHHTGDASGCAGSPTLDLGSAGSDGRVLAALPFGSWEIRVAGQRPQGSWPVVMAGTTAHAHAVVVTVGGRP